MSPPAEAYPLLALITGMVSSLSFPVVNVHLQYTPWDWRSCTASQGHTSRRPMNPPRVVCLNVVD